MFYKHDILATPDAAEHYKEPIGFNIIRAKPLYFISGLEYVVGNGGWTESNAFLSFNSGAIMANHYGRYNHGAPFAVRCLARKQ